MRKSMIRTLSLIGLIGFLLGVAGILVGIFVGKTSFTDASGTHLTAIGIPALFVSGIVIATLANITGVIARVFALIRTAQLQRWGWFATMLVLGDLVTILWSTTGPDTPAPPISLAAAR